METGDDLSFDERDSAPFMPKSVVIDPHFDWQAEAGATRAVGPHRPLRDPRARLHQAAPEGARGAARHLRGPRRTDVVDYIKSLGVTSVELLPVHSFVHDSHLLEKGLTNYWGYNTIGFFAPDRATRRSPTSLREFKEMVARSTRPGSRSSWTWSTTTPPRATSAGRRCRFKGIDNASYYRLMPDEPRYYMNDTGTGNTVNLRIRA